MFERQSRSLKERLLLANRREAQKGRRCLKAKKYLAVLVLLLVWVAKF